MSITPPADSPDAKAFDAWLKSLPDQIRAMSHVEQYWREAGSYTARYLVGDTATDTSTLDGALNLLSKWEGPAATEFRRQADIIKQFGLSVAGNATSAVTAQLSGGPAGDKWWLDDLLCFTKTITDVSSVLSTVDQMGKQIRQRWSDWKTYVATQMYNLYEVAVVVGHRTPNPWVALGSTIIPGAPAVEATWSSFQGLGDGESVTWQISSFSEFVAGHGQTASLTITPGENAWTVVFYYANAGAKTGEIVGHFDYWFKGDHDQIGPLTSAFEAQVGPSVDRPDDQCEYYQVLLDKALPVVRDGYAQIKQPSKVDDSHLPKGTATPGNNWPPFSGGGGAPFSPLSNDFGSGLPPSDPSGNGPLGDGSLAGLGSGFGPGGIFTPGTGLGSDGTIAGYAGEPGAGAGALATEGATAGAGRSGMPMMPLQPGMGGGRDGKERQRQSWLPESDDVWGADSDAPGPVS